MTVDIARPSFIPSVARQSMPLVPAQPRSGWLEDDPLPLLVVPPQNSRTAGEGHQGDLPAAGAALPADEHLIARQDPRILHAGLDDPQVEMSFRTGQVGRGIALRRLGIQGLYAGKQTIYRHLSRFFRRF